MQALLDSHVRGELQASSLNRTDQGTGPLVREADYFRPACLGVTAVPYFAVTPPSSIRRRPLDRTAPSAPKRPRRQTRLAWMPGCDRRARPRLPCALAGR